jgi:predicted protein tyrosine phosphatase
MNKWRSPTAEKIYKRTVSVSTRSAGTSTKARHTISINDIKWADIIIAMESKHKQRLIATFAQEIQHKELHVLEIEDNYTFMAPELVQELKQAIDPILIESTS